MNIAKMNRKISILEKITATDEAGFKSDTWQEVRVAWSSVSKKKIEKIEENEKATEQATQLFTIRAQELTTENRIRLSGKDYEIQSIEDEDMNSRFLVISAKEVR